METNEPACLAGLQEAMARAPRWVDTSEAILHRRRVICQQGRQWCHILQLLIDMH